MADLGEARYWSRVRDALSKGRATQTPGGRFALRVAIERVQTALSAWLEETRTRAGPANSAADLIEQLGVTLCTFLACQGVLDNVCREQRLGSTCFYVGRLIEDEIRWRAFRRTMPRYVEHTLQSHPHATRDHLRRCLYALLKRTGFVHRRWSRSERGKVGVTLVNMVVQQSGLFDIVQRPHPRKPHRTQPWISPTEDCLRWLEDANSRQALLRPLYLPTLDVPGDWDSFVGGGYLSNVVHRHGIVKCRSREHRDGLSEDPSLLGLLPSAVNGLQRVPWRIAEDVYQVVEHYWGLGLPVGDCEAPLDEPLPTKPLDIATNDAARLAYRRATTAAHSRNHRLRARRVLNARTKWAARELLGQTFYFPHYADFRGRLYPRPTALHPQGHRLARGLLQFHESVPIGSPGGLSWFMIHGANCWGEKGTLAGRRLWSEGFRSEIIASAEDPITSRWWERADRPWEFLQWCVEYRDLQEHCSRGHAPEAFMSRLVVHMDGSNNGLQLYSLLLRDEEGGRATNVLPSDTQRDIYQEVADSAYAALLDGRYPDGHEEEIPVWLSEVFPRGIPRECAKRPVMTFPYGATQYSAAQYIRDWFIQSRHTSFEGDFYGPCRRLSQVLWGAMESKLEGAVRGMTWLRNVADAFSELNRPLRWTTPSGLRVVQEPLRSQNSRLKTVLGEKVLRVRVRADADGIDRVDNRNGLPPNYIHSLDASIVHMVIQRSEIESISTVHDSFGCHAGNAPRMAREIRSVVAEMFSEDLLSTFAEECRNQGADIPDPPLYGELDVTSVVDSDYFFS